MGCSTHGAVVRYCLSVATDQDLVARWKDEPAPLLPLLHAFYERDGYLSEESLRAVSRGLRS